MNIGTSVSFAVWQDDKGIMWPIPDDLKDTKFTISGWPDKRCKGYDDFMQWVDSLNAKFTDT